MEGENRRLRWYTYVGDFINTLKAFIGTNYQSLPFAFANSGLGFGLAGVFLVATLTDHCCQLMLDCKRRLIQQICSNSVAVSSVEEDDVPQLRERLHKTLGYGDLGRRIFGMWCFHLIQFAVCFTQFTTCISYFVFIGNTVYEMFPVRQTAVPRLDDVPASYHIKAGVRNVEPYSFNKLVALDFIQSSTSHPVTTSPYINTTFTDETTLPNVTTPRSLTTSKLITTAEIVTLFPAHNTTYISISTAPDLRLITLWPLPIFLITSLVRNIRYLAPMSFVASLGLLLGIVSVLAFMITGFSVGPFDWYRFEALPLFFTQLISAYEGIGCILPIHCSMVGCRQLLHQYIHANVYIIFFVLCTFGAFGYLRYGNDVPQLLVLAITQHTALSLLVDATLLVSVVFTFPLQCFPVIEILEGYILTPGNCCDDKEMRMEYDEISTDTPPPQLLAEHESLLNDGLSVELTASQVAKTAVLPTVAAWKRNTLRILLTLVMAGLAVLLRNNYAYIAAFTGAVGCSLLAYILPCMLDLKLQGRDMPVVLIIKDSAIIAFAVFASVSGLVIIMMTVISGERPI